ncbi:MAG: DNA mismatch repair protein MutS, partial [Proteobacteria bacterium]
MPDAASPRAVYEHRLALRRDAFATADRRARRLSHARLATFAAGLLVVGLSLGADRLDPRWIALPAIAFVALVVLHDRVLRRRDEASRAVRYYEDGLARVDGAFAGRGPSGERFRDPEHPYADDLDVFGSGSLFDLLCRARTAAGEALLARWLLAPAPPDEVRERQAAVAELRDALDLRESLSLVGDSVAPGLHAEALLHWGATAPPAPAAA